jgi:Mn2+/Fe2+ NRAMP family transporter
LSVRLGIATGCDLAQALDALLVLLLMNRGFRFLEAFVETREGRHEAIRWATFDSTSL